MKNESGFRRWQKGFMFTLLSHAITSFYTLFLVIFIILCLAYYYFSPCTFSSGDIEGVRNLLNSNVQCLSAVVAIVISFSLIAVQLASQKYSERIIKMYARDCLFWIIVLQFSLSILYNLVSLNWLSGDSFNPKIGDISVFITGICFISLAPHLYNTFDQLNPEKVVLSLCREVDQEYVDLLEKHWAGGFRGSTLPEEANPLFIIEGILEKSDFATVTMALRHLGMRFSAFINEENHNVLSYHFARFFARVGRNAIDVDNEEVASLTLRCMLRMTETLVKKGFDTRHFDEHSRELGKRALSDKLVDASRHLIYQLERLAKTEIEKKLPREEEIMEYALAKGDIPEPETEEGKKQVEASLLLSHFVSERLGYLKELGVQAADSGIQEVAVASVHSLQGIGSKLLEVEMGDLLRPDLYQELMRNTEDICFQANERHLRYLFPLGVFTVVVYEEKKKGRRNIVDIIVYHFSRIHLNAVQNGICNIHLIGNLGTVGRILTPDYEKETLLVVDTLGKMGDILKERQRKETYPLEIQELRKNLGYIGDVLESMEKWKNHKNEKIITAARSWREKLTKNPGPIR